jgi:hypothetical protein
MISVDSMKQDLAELDRQIEASAAIIKRLKKCRRNMALSIAFLEETPKLGPSSGATK